ncbi:GNAT family N-acetyltransferase [Brachybacterium sp. Z12]|uniref:GNAT family N-acetyltransferase n=1 Tax=Brachybacterium sp. Z12 TaxID=2759167 RepID=UPI00185F2C6B|nr:GNAT family protein [Brachybacterium sp. Z12]QNN82860.1 GNAT family N-acetyltransferase [Brachybacterium sp. Z12]
MLDISFLPVSDDRVRLRAMAHADATAYAQGTEDEAVRAFAHLPAPQYTPDSVIRMIDGTIAEGLARGDLAILTIADAVTDRFAGSLVLFDVTEDAAEVGFWLRPEARGASLTSAALGLAVLWAQQSGLRALTARTSADNMASRHVLAKGGFLPIRRARGTAPSGSQVDLVHYERVLPDREDPDASS